MQFRFSICNSVRYTVTPHSDVLQFCAHTSVCVGMCVCVSACLYITKYDAIHTFVQMHWKCWRLQFHCEIVFGSLKSTTTTINKTRAVVVAVAFSSGAETRTFYSSLIYRKCRTSIEVTCVQQSGRFLMSICVKFYRQNPLTKLFNGSHFKVWRNLIKVSKLYKRHVQTTNCGEFM